MPFFDRVYVCKSSTEAYVVSIKSVVTIVIYIETTALSPLASGLLLRHDDNALGSASSRVKKQSHGGLSHCLNVSIICSARPEQFSLEELAKVDYCSCSTKRTPQG